jgi:hypothetical protein
MQKCCCWVLILIFCRQLGAQNDSATKVSHRNRKIVLGASTGALTVGSLVFLNQAWYSEFNTGKFHLFNDNAEWLQMDKAGHFYTTYQMSRLMMESFEWAGFNRKTKLVVGGGIGFVYMTAIEIMDGFSRGWGYSWGDQVADIGGCVLGIGQEVIWKEQRLQIKFSYAQSGLAQYNPSLLGENKYTRILKDYNGQTYWLSFSPFSFAKRSALWPKFICISIGYGAWGMLGGYYNKFVAQDNNGNVYLTERTRRYFVSLDLDLTRIKCRSKVLKGFLSIVNILKFPAPAIEFSGKGVKFHGIYY